jgi:hypothetical protein
MATTVRPLVRPGVALVLAIAVGAGPGAAASPGDRIFRTDALHRIHVTMSAAEWAVLQTSTPRGGTAGGARAGSDYRDASGRLIHIGSGFGGYFPWATADVRIDSGGPPLVVTSAGVRYKGNLSFQSTSAAAPLFANFKLKLDLHGKTDEWDGEKTFNLHAGVVDTSKMREAVAYTIFRDAGVPAPRTAFVELFFTVPGLYANTPAGLFTLIEDVNKTFLERVLPPGHGLLMKPEGLRGGIQSLGDVWSSYVAAYRPDRDATPAEAQRVMAFARLVSQPDVQTFRREIGSFLDVDLFLRYLAVNAFIVNADSYLRGSHNFYLYLDPADGRFRFLPWDQDLSMGTRPGRDVIDMMRPLAGDQPLIYWLLEDPVVAARYRAIVQELSETAFAAPRLVRLVDALSAIGTGRGPSPRAFLESRAAYLKQLLGGG